MSRLLRSLGFVAALAFARPARAEPQAHAAWRTAPCGIGGHEQLWHATRWCNGLVGDLLFFRRRNADFGFGPYVEVGSAGFWDARFGGGASLLAPVSENFPLVMSFGVYDHELRAASLAGTLFWGARSYNFDGVYNWTLGLYASGYRDLDARGETLLSAGLEIDGFFIAAPFMFAFQALR